MHKNFEIYYLTQNETKLTLQIIILLKEYIYNFNPFLTSKNNIIKS